MTTGDEGRKVDAEVAERVCGWSDFFESPYNGAFLGLPAGAARPRSGNTANHKVVPHYSTDLNACAEAEKALTAQQRSNYVGHLIAIVNEGVPMSMTTSTSRRELAIFATPAQRCRAMLACLANGGKGVGGG